MWEAYKIGITLSLTNHVSHGLALMARDFAATDAQATMLQKRITGIQNDAIKGGLMLGAGVGILALFKAPLEEAKKFDQALGKFKLLGLSDAQNADAVKFVRAMDTMGTSYVENMKLMIEAQGVFRESGLAGDHALAGAKLAAPMLAKIQFASAALDGESQAKMHTQSLAMLRFVEMRGGLKDAPTFNKIADAGWKAIQSSGGNVNFEQLRQFMARGGVAAQGLSDTSLYAKLEPIIGELKGSTAGNAMMTAYNRLVGGVRVPNQVAHLLADNGVWDKSKIEWNSMGGIKRFDGNPLKDMATFKTDPVEFYEKTLLPMYAKMNGGKGLDTGERARENTMIFGRTGGMMFSLIDRQLETIHRSVGAWEKAQGVDKSVAVAGGTLAGKEVDLHAKWAKVLNDLGNTILPMAISGVEGLTGFLKGLDAWINNNQLAVKGLAAALGVLAGGLMIRGTVLLLSAAFRGLGLAMAFQAAGGPAGLASLAGRLAGVGTGLNVISGGAGAAAGGLTTLGSALGGAAVGIGLLVSASIALVGATTVLAKTLKWLDSDTDPINHPGMRRKHLRGRADVWEKDDSLDQTHVGTHFERAGRSGTWVRDAAPALVAPPKIASVINIPFLSTPAVVDGGRYRMGAPRGTVVAPPAPAMIARAASPQAIQSTAIAKAAASAQAAPSTIATKAAASARTAPPTAITAGQARPVTVKPSSESREPRTGAPYASAPPAPIQVVSNTFLDGRLISQTVTKNLVRDAMRPTAGMSGFDGSMAPMYPSQAR